MAEVSVYDRNVLLNHKVLHPLIGVLVQALVRRDKHLIKRGAWALSALCRGDPLPDFRRVRNAIPVLCTVIKEVMDTDILNDALWAVSYHSGEQERVARVLKVDVVPSLIRCLGYGDEIYFLE